LKPKRILIVDDHPVLRKGLARLIETKNGFEVCGEASDALEAMQLIRSLQPDLVMVDLVLPGESGIALTKKIRGEFPKLPVLVLSMHEEAPYAARALRAGAMGYIVKQDAIDNIVTALGDVLSGKRYLSPNIAKELTTQLGSEDAADSDPTRILSDRELEILELIGKGQEVRDIAAKLRLSPKTVETHRTHIKEKLKLQNSRQVARFAVQWVFEQNA
jgi:DNA-binding NarL/FixJ family response regulator